MASHNNQRGQERRSTRPSVHDTNQEQVHKPSDVEKELVAPHTLAELATCEAQGLGESARRREPSVQDQELQARRAQEEASETLAGLATCEAQEAGVPARRRDPSVHTRDSEAPRILVMAAQEARRDREAADELR